MPPYRQFARREGYPNTELLSASGLSLPSAITLTDDEVDYVTTAIHRVMDVRMITDIAQAH